MKRVLHAWAVTIGLLALSTPASAIMSATTETTGVLIDDFGTRVRTQGPFSATGSSLGGGLDGTTSGIGNPTFRWSSSTQRLQT